jgi:ubiquitin thioesterase OTU1
MKVRVRCPSKPQPLSVDIPDDVPLSMLPMLLEHEVGIPAATMVISVGFPPKPIEYDAMVSLLVSHKLRDGDMITVKQGEGVVKRGHTDGKYVPPCEIRGAVMVRREVPADNSCLFHAVTRIIEDGSTATQLRSRIAEIVITHPAKFTAVYLGMPPAQYASWIAHPDTWGGAIELQILSFVYQCEIVVVDVTNRRVEPFGQGEGYTTRGFVYYTGKHYDALAVTSASGEVRGDQFLFNANDDRVFRMAVEIAEAGAKG